MVPHPLNKSLVMKFAKRNLKSYMDKVSPQCKVFLDVVSQLLCGLPGQRELISPLTSISGDLLLVNLLTGSTHCTCKNPRCHKEVWKLQSTPLAMSKPLLYCPSRRGSSVQLTPRYLLPISDDPVEFLVYLSQVYHLLPVSASIDIGALSSSFCSTSTETNDMKFSSILNRFLEKIEVLRLSCDKYHHVRLMTSMIEAGATREQGSTLKHLICTIPDMYVVAFLPLLSLFLLHDFCQLTVFLSDVSLPVMCKLIEAFLAVPCHREQKLLIHTKSKLFPALLEASKVATMDFVNACVPSCALQHKVIEFSSAKHFTNSLYLFLQFPTIRLKELILVQLSEYYKYLHLCAVHPDLQMSVLVVEINREQDSLVPQLLPTFQTDLTSLIMKPSLQKVAFHGGWGKFDDVKLSLVRGLEGRAVTCLTPLTLELPSRKFHSVRDFGFICDVIFSLPRLENLRLCLGEGYSSMLRHKVYEETLTCELESECISGQIKIS